MWTLADMIVSLIRVLAERAGWRCGGVDFMEMMVCRQPPVLKFVDGEATVSCQAVNCAVVWFPVNEIPDVRLPVVAGNRVVSQSGSHGSGPDKEFEVAGDAVLIEYQCCGARDEVVGVRGTFGEGWEIVMEIIS